MRIATTVVQIYIPMVFPADTGKFTDVLQSGHSLYQRYKDQGNGDQLEKADEDLSPRLYPVADECITTVYL